MIQSNEVSVALLSDIFAVRRKSDLRVREFLSPRLPESGLPLHLEDTNPAYGFLADGVFDVPPVEAFIVPDGPRREILPSVLFPGQDGIVESVSDPQPTSCSGSSGSFRRLGLEYGKFDSSSNESLTSSFSASRLPPTKVAYL